MYTLLFVFGSPNLSSLKKTDESRNLEGFSQEHG